jgi:hypothetical protein
MEKGAVSLALLMVGSPAFSTGLPVGVRRLSVKDDDIKRLRVGSLVRYTHFGRHEAEKFMGVVMEIKEWKYRNTYADIRWFDGLSHGEHNLNHPNISLISA